MKSKKELKWALKILEKKRKYICFEMDLEYEVIKSRLMESYQTRKDFKEAVHRTKIKKEFRKAFAKALGVEYSVIKDRLPVGLNSTIVANCLDAHLDHLRHGEIRHICQQVKMDFDDFM